MENSKHYEQLSSPEVIESRLAELEAENRELKAENKDLKQNNAELERLAYYDAKTGLLNLNGLARELKNRNLLGKQEDAEIEHDPERRGKKSKKISIMIIDIDRFKSVNDTFGHVNGDVVLKAVAEKLRLSVRKDDIVARWGGEELVGVFIGTDPKGIKEKFHMRTEDDIEKDYPGHARFNTLVEIEDVEVNEGVKFNITASAGVTSFNPATETFEQAFERADAGLYRAKEEGRDRILEEPAGVGK